MLEEAFELQENEGQNKLETLEQAVRRNIKAGMTLYITNECGAAVCEIIRQNWGKKPGFTLIGPLMCDHLLSLIYCGLAKKIVLSTATTLYPAPGPSPIIQSAYRGNKVQFEN